jgi:hypothetical protein
LNTTGLDHPIKMIKLKIKMGNTNGNHLKWKYYRKCKGCDEEADQKYIPVA